MKKNLNCRRLREDRPIYSDSGTLLFLLLCGSRPLGIPTLRRINISGFLKIGFSLVNPRKHLGIF
jgi:hypothetical protein